MTTSAPSIKEDVPYDAPQISEDFLGGDIEQGLAKVRKRLLDLGNRNRLLNFRYYKRSSLRVVDELPDVLFGHLRDGHDLRFRAEAAQDRAPTRFNRRGDRSRCGSTRAGLA